MTTETGSSRSEPPSRGTQAPVVFCDYIADCIRHGLHDRIQNGYAGILATVSRVKWDLHPTEGWMQSTKKTLEATDKGGTRYRITVEEITP